MNTKNIVTTDFSLSFLHFYEVCIGERGIERSPESEYKLRELYNARNNKTFFIKGRFRSMQLSRALIEITNINNALEPNMEFINHDALTKSINDLTSIRDYFDEQSEMVEKETDKLKSRT